MVLCLTDDKKLLDTKKYFLHKYINNTAKDTILTVLNLHII